MKIFQKTRDLVSVLRYLVHLVGYVKARLSEKTTWASVVLAITGAAALASPYSWIVIGCGVMGALVPGDILTKTDGAA